jgi:pimeloyl-ACP methyl ester carboxylesterase
MTSIDEVIERALAFNPRRDPRLLRLSLRHNLRQTPKGDWMWKYDQRHRGRVEPGAYEHRRALLWDAVGKVACPTLVVRGAQSDVFHDEDAERLAAALARGRWVRVEHAGHTVQGDNPAGLLTELRAFFAGLDA